MEQDILVTTVSCLLQLSGLVVLATIFLAPVAPRGLALEKLLMGCILGLGVVTVIAGLDQLACSLSGGLTSAVLTLGVLGRVSTDMRRANEYSVYSIPSLPGNTGEV